MVRKVGRDCGGALFRQRLVDLRRSRSVGVRKHVDERAVARLHGSGDLEKRRVGGRFDRRTARFAVVRLTSGGTLDTSFSGDGIINPKLAKAFKIRITVEGDTRSVFTRAGTLIAHGTETCLVMAVPARVAA